MNQDIIESAKTVSLFCRMQMRKDLDIPVRQSEMGVLIYVHESKDPVTPRMVSAYFRIRKPSVTAMVRTLVNEGYLKKEASEKDKRSYTLACTEKGDDLVKGTFDDYHRSIRQLKKSMGDEAFGQLITLMHEANRVLGEGEL